MIPVKHARKLVIAVIGSTIILGGLAMMVLPGPATVVIPLGIAVLSTEFLWARRLLRYLRSEMGKAARKLTSKEDSQQEKPTDLGC